MPKKNTLSTEYIQKLQDWATDNNLKFIDPNPLSEEKLLNFLIALSFTCNDTTRRDKNTPFFTVMKQYLKRHKTTTKELEKFSKMKIADIIERFK